MLVKDKTLLLHFMTIKRVPAFYKESRSRCESIFQNFLMKYQKLKFI